MIALLLGVFLTLVPADTPSDLDACLAQEQLSQPPISWGNGVEKMWTESQPVPLDTLRASLSEIREVRDCLLALDPSAVKRPYLDDLMRTFYVETALLAGLRRFPEAFETFEKGRSFLADQPTADSVAAVQEHWFPILHRNQGYLHYQLGDLLSSAEQYLKAYETTPETETNLRVEFLLDVGLIHSDMRDYSTAQHYYERAERRLSSASLSPNRGEDLRARVFNRQSELLLKQVADSSFRPALLRRARDLARKGREIADPGTKQHAWVSIALSESLGYLESFEEAYELNEEVLRYAQSNQDPSLQAFAQLKRGVLHMQTEQWAQAEVVLKKAQNQAEQLGDLDFQRRIFRALGRLHEIQGNAAAAEDHYRQGVSIIEEYRESLTATQWSMMAFSQWQDVYRGLVRTLLAQNRAREALMVLDRTRARHLQDLRTQARISDELSPNQRVRYDSLAQALTDVRNKLNRGSLTPSTETRLRDREASLMAARRQLLDFESEASRPTLEAVQKELGRKNRSLVSYFIDDPWPIFDRAPRSTAFVLSKDTLRTVALEGLHQDSLQQSVKAIAPLLFANQGKPESIQAMHFDLQPLHDLYEAVYAPVAELLPKEHPLTVVPDGPLFHVPPSMLVRSMPGGRFGHDEARFVLHERPIALELASSLVADTSEVSLDESQYEPELAAFGVSDFDSLKALPSNFRAALPDASDGSSRALPSLPGVESELYAVQRFADDAMVAHNEAATESAFQEVSQRAGVLHLASHAFVHPSSPLQNAFLLHPDTASEQSSDGVLFLHELQNQECQIPLVVLSGCSTARGTLRQGEGMAGLQYAFRAMGAQSTVATLWPAADKPSVELMTRFYRHLQDGMSKDRALRQTKLDFLQHHPDKASPFFWAPAVLYGSPVPVEFGTSSTSSRWAWSLFGLVAVLLLLGLLFWRASPPLPSWLRRQLPS